MRNRLEYYLDHELQIMKPRRFGLNLPGCDFRFERPGRPCSCTEAFIGIIAMYLGNDVL
ncbi:DUF3360 domain-containing protein [Vibrio chagasii]|nr:DUF3360 domain-containing protein [Vibrio chagasii]